MAKLLLGLQHAEELPPVVRSELEQLIAAVQQYATTYLDVEGVNTGDQTITLSGDVTGSGTGAITTTIANDAVTYAKMQNVSATDRLLGRDTAGSGNVEELTVSGGVEFTGSGGIQRSALTGDVTASAGSGATTLANSGVTAGSYTITSLTVDAKGRITAASSGTASSTGGHLHGLQRVLGDGSTTTFNLLDTAEYLEHVGVAGSFRDPSLFSLSADGTQIVFAAAPGAGDVIAIEYVIANA